MYKRIPETEYPNIIEFYQGDGQSAASIARMYGVSENNIIRILKKHGIERRGRYARWDKERTCTTTSSGYVIRILEPTHPYYDMTQATGYVREHRLVMAEYLKRSLYTWESVHHINGNRQDNRIENLQLRIGNHGAGVVAECGCCGSNNIVYKEIA